MENNINNYYGENIEEMGKKVWNQPRISSFLFQTICSTTRPGRNF